MLTFSGDQTTATTADVIKATWLFDIGDDQYSTEDGYSYGGDTYSGGITDFSGIYLSRSKSEYGIQAPSSLNFTIINSGNALGISDFQTLGEYDDVTVRLLINDELIDAWTFKVKSIVDNYQRLHFTCEDVISQYLDGVWPNTPLVSSLIASDDGDRNDNACIPVPFGTCYAPLRSVYITDQRYYVLGLSSFTYNITEVASPRAFGAITKYSSGSYTFTQSTEAINGTNYRVFEPIIADSDGDGSVDACGLWRSGDKFLDMPTKFTRNDTASMTNPADIIEFVLEDMGVPSGLIDSTSFTAAGTTFTGWGMAWNGAFTEKKDKREILAQLLNACNAHLIITDKVGLYVYSKTSQKTIATADIVGEHGKPGTFKITGTKNKTADSGYVGWQQSGEPQDEIIKTEVSGDGNFTEQSDEILEMPFQSDSQDAQRAGELYFLRKLFIESTGTFTGLPKLLALQPGDVITISGAQYGGSTPFPVLIDSIKILNSAKRAGCVEISFSKYSVAFEDWGDSTPSAVSVETDDSVPWDYPILEYQYSVDGSTSWHTDWVIADKYRRHRVKGTVTWSDAYKIVGEDGAAGATGPAGAAGDDGPGLLFQGGYDPGTTYYVSSTRRDIVKYNSYYYARQVSNGSGAAPSGSASDNTYWEYMASFASIATDILLAQDVTILRTLNMENQGGSDIGRLVLKNGTDLTVEDGGEIVVEDGGDIILDTDTGSGSPSMISFTTDGTTDEGYLYFLNGFDTMLLSAENSNDLQLKCGSAAFNLSTTSAWLNVAMQFNENVTMSTANILLSSGYYIGYGTSSQITFYSSTINIDGATTFEDATTFSSTIYVNSGNIVMNDGSTYYIGYSSSYGNIKFEGGGSAGYVHVTGDIFMSSVNREIHCDWIYPRNASCPSGGIGASSYSYTNIYGYNLWYYSGGWQEVADNLDDIELLCGIEPLKDQDGKPILSKSGLQVIDHVTIPDEITNLHNLVDEFNEENGEEIVKLQDLKDLKAGNRGPIAINSDKGELYLLDQEALRKRTATSAGAYQALVSGAVKRQESQITDDYEQFNSLIESLTSRITALEAEIITLRGELS